MSRNLIDFNNALGGKAALAVRDINSALQAFHGDVNLSEGRFLVVPNPDSRWTLNTNVNGGAHDIDFHGGGEFDGTTINIPLNPMRLGGLVGVLFDSAGNPADVFQFPPDTIQHVLNVPPGGGTLKFIIGDFSGTYGDNDGVANVAVFRSE